METGECFYTYQYIRKEFLVHQHGRLFIVWNTNVAAVMKCENALFKFNSVELLVRLFKFRFVVYSIDLHVCFLQDEKTTSVEKKVKELTDDQGRLQKTNQGLQVYRSSNF